VVENKKIRVFRDKSDFSCGQGLQINLKCLEKTLDLNDPKDIIQDPIFILNNPGKTVYYTYAI
jgi:hypothetical protein